MKKNPHVYLGHILDSIEWIEKHMSGLTAEEFLDNVATQDAVIRRIQIIGEAVKKLPDGIKEKTAEVPWRKIAGIRDKVIHDYVDVDIELVWEIVQKDLQPLKEKVQELMRDEA